jgi:hypothetical protein
MAGFYEHSMKLPRLLPEKALEDMLVLKFKDIYNKLNTEYILSPDPFFMFELDSDINSNINYFKEYFVTQETRV